jgi:hypothetical protein
MALLNATIVDIQPTDEHTNNADFAIPATTLATDIAAQVRKSSINFTHRLTRLRRQNACVGLKGKVIDILADDLFDIPYDKDASLLFGEQFHKTKKRAAKKEGANRTTRKGSSNQNYSGNYSQSRGNRGGSETIIKSYGSKNNNNYGRGMKRYRGRGQSRF